MSVEFLLSTFLTVLGTTLAHYLLLRLQVAKLEIRLDALRELMEEKVRHLQGRIAQLEDRK